MSNQAILPRGVYLIGAGVVGRAILRAHVLAGVSVHIVDQSPETVQAAVDELELDASDWEITSPSSMPDGTTSIHLHRRDNDRPEKNSVDETDLDGTIVIESIVERLDTKQAFFSAAEKWFKNDAILCSNTSNLRISAIADSLRDPTRMAGMHFFMPVDRRPATEVVRGDKTSEATIRACCRHADRIHKPPLVVADGPGFIVNRMLSPYLNEALLLLGRGAPADQIERAALAYGMPMSPLELIDYIGTRTMFDAGRVFWQAFPNRLSPSPLLSGLIKRKRLGRASGAGLYDYFDGERSRDLADETIELCEKYRRHEQEFSDEDVIDLLAIPMWIEAALARRDGIANEDEHFNLAMRGGLGYDPAKTWTDFYDHLGSARIRAAIEKWSPLTASMTAPEELIESLRHSTPMQAQQVFAG